jgi:NTP pyrophosphatase (non-canonical NTP hydrolase)
MNLNEYQELSSRTANNHEYALANFGLGIAGEAGEVADLIKKVVFHNHVIDKQNICKELGDVLWYISQIASLSGLTLEEIAETNINKLKERYPEGFSTERSINRKEYSHYKLLNKIDYENYIGDILPLKDFIDTYNVQCIMPYDGSIGDVIVNSYSTNIRIVGWNMWMSTDFIEMSLEDLKNINGNVEIRWCNK